MQNTQSGTEKLNMLAAGLITALAVHALFCVAAMPAAIAASHETFPLAALKLFRLVWNLAGIGGAAYLAFQAVGMVNGRSYTQARIAAIGGLLLPLLGSPGAVTAFALIPLGLLTTYLLKQIDWQILFQDFAPAEVLETEIAEGDEAYVHAEEVEEAVTR
jgi:hypothetical protein